MPEEIIEGTAAAPETATPTASEGGGETTDKSLISSAIETPADKAEAGSIGQPEKEPAEGGEGGKAKEEGEQSVPEKYELTMPDGWQLDEAGLAALEPVMRELKASNEQVQAVADIYMKRITAVREAQVESDRRTAEAWKQEISADPEIGGAALKENLASVGKVLAKYSSQEFVQWLDDSGLGNYPPFVKTMVKMAKDLSDDRFVPGGRGGSAADPMKEAADLIYGKL